RVVARGRGLSLPGASQNGAGRLDTRRMGHHREEPYGPVLLVDSQGPKAAHSGTGKLGAAHRGSRAGDSFRIAGGGDIMAWYRRLRNVFRPDHIQEDIDRELSFHIAERADELQASGMSEEEAVRTARRQLGNFTVQVERTRDMDVAGWLDALLRNLRYSARTLAKTPVFTATVVLTLALGIGANSAVFSAIHAVLLQPLPFPEGDQLMELRQFSPTNQIPLVAPVRLEEWNRM